jgi:hypothetical protein
VSRGLVYDKNGCRKQGENGVLHTWQTPVNAYVALIVLLLPVYALAGEPSKASESAYNTDIRKATTSTGLTKADLAWHALNTYGWDCSEVVVKGELTPEGYFIITCANRTKLRVYPRKRKHPRITNIKGGYD